MEMPAPVVDVVGYALYLAQNGHKHQQVKPLKGFGSAGVLEVVEDYDGSTIAQCIPSNSAMASMCCIASRRNPARALRRQNRIRT